MNSPARSNEGFVLFRGYRTWYQIVGDCDEPGKLPLLCLHGGPGVPHDYLEPLALMAATGRRVIFYDQLGCGNSDQPHNPALWTIDLFVDEVAAVRESLGLDRVHLWAQSWGGHLAMQYMLTKPKGVASLTLASTFSSMPQWIAEANRLREMLPPDVQQTLLKHEAAGTISTPEYQNAMMVFYRRHVCRVDPMPDCVQRAFDKTAKNPEVYETMNGPTEFHVIGTIKDVDITACLGEIRVPTLITSGRHDEATPAIAEVLRRGIAGSEWVLFEHSSHMAHVEETQRYVQVLTKFISRVEANA